MPFGPYFAALPLDSGGHHYVDQTTCDAWVDNEVNWKDNVNGGGFTLSNVVLVTPSKLTALAALLTAAVQPSIAFLETGGTTGHKSGRILYDGGAVISGGGWAFQKLLDDGVTFSANLITIQASTGFIAMAGGVMPTAPLDLDTWVNADAIYLNSSSATNEYGFRVNSGGEMRIFAGGSTPVITFGRKTAGAFVEYFRILTNGISPVQVSLPVYASDAAAGAAGLTSWQMYKHSDGSVYVKA